MIRFRHKSRKYFIDGRTWATATLTATATATATSGRTHHDTATTECFLVYHEMWVDTPDVFGVWMVEEMRMKEGNLGGRARVDG
jgi:hypothetical protein